MELNSLLVPFDFSGSAGHATRYASALAGQMGAEVTILHVVPPLHYDFAMAEPSPERLREVSRRRLDRARERLAATLPGLTDAAPLNCEVMEGDAADEIVKAAQSGRFDAVVMSTRGASALRRLFMIGSVTSKVLHDAELPVITSVHFENHPSPISIRRVICAIDHGPQSKRVVCWGSNAAARFDAALDILHAAPPPDTIGGREEDAREESAARLLARMQEFGRGLPVPVTPQISFDSPAPAICCTARESRADLVVIGRGVSQDLLGRLRATAYDVIRQCPCPVVSI